MLNQERKITLKKVNYPIQLIIIIIIIIIKTTDGSREGKNTESGQVQA